MSRVESRGGNHWAVGRVSELVTHYTELTMRAGYLLAVAGLALLTPAVALGQAGTAQARLWDGAIEGDTVQMATALRDGALIDSLDTRSNPNGRRALNWAAWYNHVSAVRFLLAHGATIEARNNTGYTALHHAAEAGSVEALNALLDAGANPRAANNDGRLPAETARERGHQAAAIILEGVGH